MTVMVAVGPGRVKKLKQRPVSALWVLNVASLFKATTAFCSSFVHESEPDRGVHVRSLQVQSEIKDVLGKRKGIEREGEFVRIAKKVKLDSQALQISREYCILVGRLQLCNKKRHSWGGSSVAGDCLAFTDSTASICCSVSGGLDVSFVGKLVTVNSWSFIPLNASRASTKPNSGQCTLRTSPNISATNVLNLIGSLNPREVNSGDRTSKNFSKGEPEDGTHVCYVQSDAVDNLGYLEIHSLELIEEQDVKETTFPSLCVDPVAADIRNVLFESPLVKKEEKRSRMTICGKLKSISPQFSLPCKYTEDRDEAKTPSKVASSSKDIRQKSKQLSMIGFLAELQYCHSCSCHYIDSWYQGVRTERRRCRQLFEEGRLSPKQGQYEDHKEIRGDGSSCHVYFSGPLAVWRPILSSSFERCLRITGLRRKFILTGAGKKYQCLFVATRTSLVSPVLDANHKTARAHCTVDKSDSDLSRGGIVVHHEDCTHDREGISGRACAKYPRVIFYAGFVTAILFQGTLVELDKRVWLLLTHYGKTHLHGLRVGAMLALRDVHAVTIQNSSEKALLLGACVRSHVSVLLFSPLRTPALHQLHSPSLLLRYMQKASFASAFWILSLIGSFTQKFRGIYTSKELMGSKKDPGIIMNYVQRLLAPDDTLERPDYFKEFFDHQHMSCSGGRVASVSLSKVPPISNFCQDIETSIRDPRSNILLSRTGGSSEFQRWLEKKSLLSSSEVSLASWQSAHSIISSQELGVTLLGSLQVCQKSGQLQLKDATGFIHAVVPDLLSSTHISKSYQVSTFTLLVKELSQDSSFRDDSCERSRDFSVSWSSLLKDSKAMPTLSQASEFLVHFYVRDATLIDNLSRRCEGMGQSLSQCWNRSGLGQKHTKETWDMMELDLEVLRTWLQQRISELGSACSPKGDLKLVCDSFRGLNSTNQLFRVSCKVVAVNLLVFESQGPLPCKNGQSSEPYSVNDFGVDDDWLFPLGIPLTLASVVIDDGCELAYCWALGDAAVSLLGLLKSSCQSDLPPKLLARLGEKYGRTDMHISMEQYLYCLVRRHGKIVLRSERTCGASVDTSYSLHWCGGNSPDCVEQAFMQAVVARACHNFPLVVTLGDIPSTEKDAPESSKNPQDYCRALAYRTGFQRSPLQDDECPQLFATKVEPAVSLSDVRTVSDEIASLLQNLP